MASTVWENLGEFLDSYRPRAAQKSMAAAVERALYDQEILIAEAGTGTGKTLAYLIPLLEFARQTDTRVLVSTETRSLQSQLLEKDIPLVERIRNEAAEAQLCLGASNFICKRKMSQALDKGELLLAGSQLDALVEWEQKTPTGIRAEFEGAVQEAVWKAITREADNCLGRKCHNFSESFYFVARERWKNAKLLVANHALLASHMALDGKLLPDFSAAVIDEAHRFPGAVLDAMRASVPLNDLAGLIRQAGRNGDSARRSLETFRAEVELRFTASSRLRGPMLPDAAEMLADQLAGLESSLRENLDDEGNAQGEAGLKAQMLLNRIGQARSVIESFAAGPEAESVHWLTLDEQRVPSLHKSPLSAAAHIRHGLLEKTHTVVFTSATLSSSGAKPFAFFSGECGAAFVESKKTKYFKVSSPFEYEQKCLLFLPEEIIDPGDEDRFPEDCAYWIDRLVQMTEGGAFVLFTSKAGLKRTHALLKEKTAGRKFEIHSQVELGARNALKRFEESGGLLLGLATFWQGVDIPGDRLRLVILVKLPFQVPDDPIVQARTEKLEKQGKSSFMLMQLPHAVLSMKQGFGRLIRTEEDRGVVAILDSRIKTRRYGPEILAALPPARVVHSFEELETSYAGLFGAERPIMSR